MRLSLVQGVMENSGFLYQTQNRTGALIGKKLVDRPLRLPRSEYCIFLEVALAMELEDPSKQYSGGPQK